MTHKVAMTFKRGYGIYNAGETAGFDPDHAESLAAAEVAVKAKDQPKKGAAILVAKLESPEIDEFRRMVESAEKDLTERSDALDQREKALDDREADLNQREADLGGLVVEEDTGDSALVAADAKGGDEKTPSLPKQGK